MAFASAERSSVLRGLLRLPSFLKRRMRLVITGARKHRFKCGSREAFVNGRIDKRSTRRIESTSLRRKESVTIMRFRTGVFLRHQRTFTKPAAVAGNNG